MVHLFDRSSITSSKPGGDLVAHVRRSRQNIYNLLDDAIDDLQSA